MIMTVWDNYRQSKCSSSFRIRYDIASESHIKYQWHLE